MILFTFVLAAFPAHAQDAHETPFRNGMEAVDENDWPAVERWMSQAITHQPQSSNRRIRIYGMRLERYLPHYYLGVARFERGNCTGALDAFRNALRHGQVHGRQASRLKKLSAECGTSLGVTPPSRPRLRARPRRTIPSRTRPPTSAPTTRPRSQGGPPGVTPGPARTPSARPRRPNSPDPSGRPPASSRPVAGDTTAVRRQILTERATAARDCIEAAKRWTAALDAHRKRRRWRPTANVVGRYENTQRAVRAAHFRLGQGMSEGDLDAVESARTEACAARDEIADIGRRAGLLPPP